VDFNAREHAERDVSKALRAPPRPLDVQRVVIAGTRYASMDADSLLQSLSDADRSRPGHLFG
jgi:hypothetical protein